MQVHLSVFVINCINAVLAFCCTRWIGSSGTVSTLCLCWLISYSEHYCEVLCVLPLVLQESIVTAWQYLVTYWCLCIVPYPSKPWWWLAVTGWNILCDVTSILCDACSVSWLRSWRMHNHTPDCSSDVLQHSSTLHLCCTIAKHISYSCVISFIKPIFYVILIFLHVQTFLIYY